MAYESLNLSLLSAQAQVSYKQSEAAAHVTA